MERVDFQLRYRTNGNMILLTAYHWNMFYLGYAYEMGIGSDVNFSNGSHEIQFAYIIKEKKNKKQLISF